MNSTEQLYRDAWERLKAGKPQRIDKNMPINELKSVALEAGRKEGSLRSDNHSILCKEILNYKIEEPPLKTCIRLKNEYKEKLEEKDTLWKNALGREMMLKKRLFELEIELKRIKQKYPGIIFELDDID